MERIAKSTYCSSCFQWIPKEKVRVKMEITDAKIGPLWFDTSCFGKHCQSLGWNEPVENIPGFAQLGPDGQRAMEKHFV